MANTDTIDFAAWLEPLGLGQWAKAFETNGVLAADLSGLTHDDLRDGLGIARFADRKLLLAAVAARAGEAEFARHVEYPGGLSPDFMPAYIAHPWHALAIEDHPRVKLHWLTDTAELVVRWVVALTLAEVLNRHGDALPPATARAVRDHVERPTLGRWLLIMRELSGAKPDAELVTRGAFDLYEKSFAPLFESASRGGNLESSLLELRNQVAHGGGMSPAHAEELLGMHMPRLTGLLADVLAVTEGADVWAHQSDSWRRLSGLEPAASAPPGHLVGSTREGAWLAREDAAVPLLPLAIYEPVRVIDSTGELKDKPGGPVAQVYTRASHDRLSYTPLGRDEAHSEILDVDLFRSTFRLDEHLAERDDSASVDGVRWDDAVRDARVMSEDLVGRDQELSEVKKWLKSREPRDDEHARIGWIGGGPGLGKSMVMARLATDYSGSKHRGFFFHRFSSGSARSMRRSFLLLLEAALWAWAPLRAITEAPTAQDGEDALVDALEQRLKAVAELESPHPKAPAPALWIFVDNFDEIVGQDPRFVDLVRKFAVPGTVWLLCGRSEHGLDDEWAKAGSEHLFEGGLPLMNPGDMRAMLLEGMGNARYQLLKRDEDDDGIVHNAFVERVVENARGLPLYVQLLLDDLRAGNLTVSDDDKLPDGLGDYYDGLMERVGLSSVRRDLPLVVSTLAIAEEPLDTHAIAQLLSPHTDDLPSFERRARAALLVGQPLMRRVPTPDASDGFVLYHQSFLEYVAGKPGVGDEPDSPPAPQLAEVVAEAQRLLIRTAERWDELPHGNLRNHLFRWGTSYAVEWHGEMGQAQALARLTSYDYLHARLSALPPSAVIDLVAEYQDLVRAMHPGEERDRLAVWAAFFRERAHILARPEDSWPTHKILLQLAIEHADTSPITLAAEEWMERGNGRWLWLRRPTRPARPKENFARRVFEGHGDLVTGAYLLPHGAEEPDRILSWARDHNLKLWEMETGEEVESLDTHTDVIDGVFLLEDPELALSFSRDGSLRAWHLTEGEERATFIGHDKPVVGATELPEGKLASWSEDKTVRIWDLASGQQLDSFEGHTRAIRGALLRQDDQLLTFSDDKSLRLWDTSSGHVATFEGHTREVVGALELPDGRILSWDMDNAMILWPADGSSMLARFEGHSDTVYGARHLPADGEEVPERILSWGKDGLICRWSIDGELDKSFKGHSDLVEGVLELPDDKLVSYSKDKNLRVWDGGNGRCLETLTGHSGWVRGASLLSSGEILSWSGGGALRIWDPEDFTTIAVLEGHTAGVRGAHELPDGAILSWSWDGSLRLWDWERSEAGGEDRVGHLGWINGHDLYEPGYAISWSTDGMAIIWDLETGRPDVTLRGHEKGVSGYERIDDARALTYSSDMSLRVWNRATGECTLTIADAHTKKIQGVVELGGERVMTYSSDGDLKVWSLTTGELLTTLAGHKKLVQGAVALDDGARALSWSSDATLKVWDTATGEVVMDLTDHSKLIKGAKLFDSGSKILSWSSDKTLKIWDLATGDVLHTLSEHKKIVERARLLDATRAVSLSKDLKVLVWDLAKGELAVACEAPGEMPDSACLLDPDTLLAWQRKAETFLLFDLADGSLKDSIGYTEALQTRPELWRARNGAGRYATMVDAWRAHSGDGGASLFHDVSVPPGAIEWKETGAWSTMILTASGALSAHAGNYFHALHLHYGAGRVDLARASEILAEGEEK